MKKLIWVFAMIGLAESAMADGIKWNEYYPADMPASQIEAGSTIGTSLLCTSPENLTQVINALDRSNQAEFLEMTTDGRCGLRRPGMEYFRVKYQTDPNTHLMAFIDGNYELMWTTYKVFNRNP